MYTSRKLIGLTLAFTTLQTSASAEEQKPRIGPTAIFLDVADQCPHTEWEDWLRNAIDDRGLVKCIQIGDGFWSTFFDPLDKQIEQACHIMHNDPDFADQEINLVGFAQGGLVARGVVQRCEGLKVHTLFTFGSQHQGFKWYDFSQLAQNPLINVFNHVAHYVQEHVFLQNLFTMSEYFFSTSGWGHKYSQSSKFIQDINNVQGDKPEYKERLLSLKHFGLYWFQNDLQFQPNRSQWLSYETNYERLLPIRFQNMYTEDVLGLRELHKSNRLNFYSGIGDHMHVHEYQMVELVAPLLLDEEEVKQQEYNFMEDISQFFVN